MDCTINVAKIKALISWTVTSQLICTFVFVYVMMSTYMLISAVKEKLGSKSSPTLPVSCPFALSLSIASVAENVMGGASGGVRTIMSHHSNTAIVI